jgi:type I restriction enzyme S subunit
LVHIALLKPQFEKVNSKWLESMLNSQYCYDQSQVLTHGIANRDLGLKRMVRIKMYLPPLPLQQTFATRIQAIEALKATHRTALAELDALFASLQQRAFAGEL